jgi:hypothetical protein
MTEKGSTMMRNTCEEKCSLPALPADVAVTVMADVLMDYLGRPLEDFPALDRQDALVLATRLVKALTSNADDNSQEPKTISPEPDQTGLG